MPVAGIERKLDDDDDDKKLKSFNCTRRTAYRDLMYYLMRIINNMFLHTFEKRVYLKCQHTHTIHTRNYVEVVNMLLICYGFNNLFTIYTYIKT